jgi:hypothetical protein
MIHYLLITLLLYCTVRAALKRRRPDPMAGRLVMRDPALSRPLHESVTLQRAAIDDKVRPHNLFESPEQMRARSLRAKVAAPVVTAGA